MKLHSKIEKVVYIIEVVLAVLIAFGIIVSAFDIIQYYKIIITTAPTNTTPVVQAFLGHILTLVIGLELIIMLVKHTATSVIEVLLFAIARKMVIEAKGMQDFLLGIIAIGILFFINKVFDPGRNFVSDINFVNPTTLVRDVNKSLDISIPEDMGNTIGGVVFNLCKECGETLKEGKVSRLLMLKLQF